MLVEKFERPLLARNVLTTGEAQAVFANIHTLLQVRRRVAEGGPLCWRHPFIPSAYPAGSVDVLALAALPREAFFVGDPRGAGAVSEYAQRFGIPLSYRAGCYGALVHDA